MRTLEQKKKITDRYESATIHRGVVNQGLINQLMNQFHTSKDIVEKNTGPIVMIYKPDIHGYQEWIEPVQKLIDNLIGNNTIWSCNIFKVHTPHIVHNDDYLEKVYDIFKTVVIPMEIKEPTNFIVFDQYYLDGPIKCLKGYPEGIVSHYNETLRDYSNIVNITDEPFDKRIYEEYLTHIPYEALHGLTVEAIVPWQPGDAITFDMGKLHSATNFTEHGIDYKIGFSIFTAK